MSRKCVGCFYYIYKVYPPKAIPYLLFYPNLVGMTALNTNR